MFLILQRKSSLDSPARWWLSAQNKQSQHGKLIGELISVALIVFSDLCAITFCGKLTDGGTERKTIVIVLHEVRILHE